MKKMNYEAPVAEMIEMQASMVLMSSGETPTEPTQIEQGEEGSDMG
jgi:hypothetical protein